MASSRGYRFFRVIFAFLLVSFILIFFTSKTPTRFFVSQDKNPLDTSPLSGYVTVLDTAIDEIIVESEKKVVVLYQFKTTIKTDEQFVQQLAHCVKEVCPIAQNGYYVRLDITALTQPNSAQIDDALKLCNGSKTEIAISSRKTAEKDWPKYVTNWHDAAYKWYLLNHSYFITSIPDSESELDLFKLLLICKKHGVAVDTSSSQYCFSQSHYEALGCLYPVGVDPKQLFPTFNSSSSPLSAWQPWVACIYGKDVLTSPSDQTQCEERTAKARLETDKASVQRWREVRTKDNLSPNPPNKVISISLYGTSPKYTYGAIRNAILARIHYPDWQFRVYKREEEPGKDVINKLRSLGAFLFNIPSSNKVPPMMWRFLVADDDSVDVFIIRDSDSRISKREVALVDEWLQSNATFHCIRDHPSHSNYAVSGGIWGARSGPLAKLVGTPWSELAKGKSGGYLADMNLLGSVIWPKVKDHAFCHDAFSCEKYPNSHKFPVARIGAEHVGQVFSQYDEGRAGDMNTIRSAKPNKHCSPD